MDNAEMMSVAERLRKCAEELLDVATCHRILADCKEPASRLPQGERLSRFYATARYRGYVTSQRRLVPHQKIPPHLRRFWCNAY